MKLRTLFGVLALCAAFAAGATTIHDDELKSSLGDALGGASLYALTDPSHVPAPAAALLLALGLGLLSVSASRRRPDAP